MKTPYLGRQFFKTLLQKIQYYKVDATAGDANAAAYKNYIPRLPSCNERSTWDAHLKADFILIITPKIISVSFAQKMILIVAAWLVPHGKNRLVPK